MIPARHGGQLRAIAQAFNVPIEHLRDFSANINPDGPPPSVLAALRQALRHPSTLTQYPDLEEHDLKSAIARDARCDLGNVLVGNGFVPLLQAVVQALGIRTCLLPVPSFNEYRTTLRRHNVAVHPLLLDSAQNFRYDPDAILDELLAQNCDAILLANPQNPSGVVCAKQQMLQLIEIAASRGIYILLDEAFIDYHPQAGVLPEALQLPNLVVFRSVTKSFGIPGLRIAYAVASEPVRTMAQRLLPPWPISTLASVAVIAALADTSFRARLPALNQDRRSELASKLSGLGMHVYPAAANFLLFRLPAQEDAVSLWRRLILEDRLVLRSCIDFEGLPPGHLRVAVKHEADNLALVNAISDKRRSA